MWTPPRSAPRARPGATSSFLAASSSRSCRPRCPPGSPRRPAGGSREGRRHPRPALGHLPRLSADAGFHYLDNGPFVLAEAGLAVVGSMNWYDYTWTDLAALATDFPDWQDRLRTKRFSRGRHNDARFVRWPPYNDVSFTAEAVATFARHLREA